MYKLVYTRSYISINFVNFWSYFISNSIPFLDFFLPEKGADPAKYIMQYSLIALLIAFLSDLIQNKTLNTVTLIAILSYVYYLVVVGIYYAGQCEETPDLVYPSVKKYRDIASRPFEFVKGKQTYHVYPLARYVMLMSKVSLITGFWNIIYITKNNKSLNSAVCI